MFLNQQWFFQAEMVIIASGTNDFEIFLLTSAVMAIHMVKDCRIIPIIWVEGEFLMGPQWNSQMLKDSNQVMTSRFSYVDGIAVIARIAVK